jgi:hypothetical protein
VPFQPLTEGVESSDNLPVEDIPTLGLLAQHVRTLEETFWGAINIKNEQIHDLEDTVEELQRDLNNHTAMFRLWCNQRNIDTSPSTFPPPLRLERQIAQSDVRSGICHVIPFPMQEHDDDHADDLSVSTSVSTHSLFSDFQS